MHTRKCIGCNERFDEEKLIGGYCKECHEHVSYSEPNERRESQTLDKTMFDVMLVNGYTANNPTKQKVDCTLCDAITRSRYSICPECRKNLMK